MIKEVETMPWEAEYPARVTAAMLRYGMDTLLYTKRYYEVRNSSGELILGAGVALWSFARPPELWIMLAKPYFLNLRESLRLTAEALPVPATQYPNLVCDVLKTNKSEIHFVRHMGWRPTNQRSLRPRGDDYIQFEVK